MLQCQGQGPARLLTVLLVLQAAVSPAYRNDRHSKAAWRKRNSSRPSPPQQPLGSDIVTSEVGADGTVETALSELLVESQQANKDAYLQAALAESLMELRQAGQAWKVPPPKGVEERFMTYEDKKVFQIRKFKARLFEVLELVGITQPKVQRTIGWTQMWQLLRTMGYPGTTNTEEDKKLDASAQAAKLKEREEAMKKQMIPDGGNTTSVKQFVKGIIALMDSLFKFPYSPMDLNEAFSYFSLSQIDKDRISIQLLNQTFSELKLGDADTAEFFQAMREADKEAGGSGLTTTFSATAAMQMFDPGSLKRVGSTDGETESDGGEL